MAPFSSAAAFTTCASIDGSSPGRTTARFARGVARASPATWITFTCWPPLAPRRAGGAPEAAEGGGAMVRPPAFQAVRDDLQRPLPVDHAPVAPLLEHRLD